MRLPRRQRGNFSILVALILPVLIGFVALVVDLGNFWRVRRELQMGADAAALAGVRDLDGFAPGLVAARLTTQRYGLQHQADKTAIALDLNAGNAASGDIVLGHWDMVGRTFVVATGGMPLYRINAVRATARRTTATGNAVATFFARIFGSDSGNVTATSIAVGGGAGAACGFPVAVPSCALLDGAGNFVCPTNFVFRGGSGEKDAGFTLLTLERPNSASVRDAVSDYLAGNCTGLASVGDDIFLQNGNDLPRQSFDEINDAVVAAGANGLFVTIPIVDFPDCARITLNRSRPLIGFLQVRLLAATWAPNKEITATGDCTRVTPDRAGGSIYGAVATDVYLVR